MIAVAGSLGPGHEAVLRHGIVLAEASTPPGMPLDEGLTRAHELVAAATERALRRFTRETSGSTQGEAWDPSNA